MLLPTYKLLGSRCGKPAIKLILNHRLVFSTYIIQVISLSGGAILRHNMVLAHHAMISCPELPRLTYSEPVAASPSGNLAPLFASFKYDQLSGIEARGLLFLRSYVYSYRHQTTH
jgi:hypothetical protein